MLADVRGYLREDYRLFHLRDSRAEEIGYHYHEFDKVLFFYAGEVTYLVEGRVYDLRSGDVLLIPHHQIHQPIIRSAQPYERRLLWLSPELLTEYGLSPCFDEAAATGSHLLRSGQEGRVEALRLAEELEEAEGSAAFASALLARTYCIQLLIALNRAYGGQKAQDTAQGRNDPRVDAVLAYLRAHLTEDLSVDALAERFHISRSGLMSRFKEATGCTIHQYVVQKRLIRAAELLREGAPVRQAAADSGFQDYSTFLRAFRKRYGVSPRELR
ncbi:MAG: AraC family transcriptional regulator [Clostridiales bacterium]|nr:AraC family transcriptional regulator [Clostridiales bacterium]